MLFIYPFRAVGELLDCVVGRRLGACALRFPKFILLGSFSDTLIVISILGMVIAICSRFCSSEGVIKSSCGNYGFFLTWG